MRNSLVVALILLATASAACQLRQGQFVTTKSPAVDPNRYYAVLLTNNSVYFGKLEGVGTAFPVLTDVYYVQSGVSQETKAVSNVLIKRGREWHSPDRMIISEKSIVFIEPVGLDSKVAQLIVDSKR
jgi:hypothetical protein